MPEDRVADMEQELEKVEDDIAKARREADEVLPKRDEHEYHDSGDVHPEMDDQSITP